MMCDRHVARWLSLLQQMQAVLVLKYGQHEAGKADLDIIVPISLKRLKKYKSQLDSIWPSEVMSECLIYRYSRLIAEEGQSARWGTVTNSNVAPTTVLAYSFLPSASESRYRSCLKDWHCVSSEDIPAATGHHAKDTMLVSSQQTLDDLPAQSDMIGRFFQTLHKKWIPCFDPLQLSRPLAGWKFFLWTQEIVLDLASASNHSHIFETSSWYANLLTLQYLSIQQHVVHVHCSYFLNLWSCSVHICESQICITLEIYKQRQLVRMCIRDSLATLLQ